MPKKYLWNHISADNFIPWIVNSNFLVVLDFFVIPISKWNFWWIVQSSCWHWELWYFANLHLVQVLNRSLEPYREQPQHWLSLHEARNFIISCNPFAVAMRSGVHPVQSEALGWLVHLANDLTTSQPPCNRSPRWTIHYVCFVLIFTRG